MCQDFTIGATSEAPYEAKGKPRMIGTCPLHSLNPI